MNDTKEAVPNTDSLRTGAGYALGVGLHATYKAMTEAADTIDTLRAENERLRACFDWANGAAEEGWLPAQEVRKLRAQLAEAQRDAKLERALQKAAKDLPVNWSIHVAVERNAGWVELLNADGDFEDFEDADRTLAEQVISANDAAKEKKNGS